MTIALVIYAAGFLVFGYSLRCIQEMIKEMKNESLNECKSILDGAD